MKHFSIRHSHLSFSIIAACLLLLTAACDDTTGSIGSSVTPTGDSLSIRTATFYARSRSLKVDSILAKTNTTYFGRFIDPETNSLFEADFMTQVNCFEGGTVFPDADKVLGDTAERVELRLFFTSFFGDSLNAMKLEVYPLSEVIGEGEHYYTNVDPTRFYDAGSAPIATKVFSAIDCALKDSILKDENHYNNVCVPLPRQIGTDIIHAYREHPEYFASATPFLENVCRGFYIRCTQGNGTVLYLDQVNLNISFTLAENDSVYTSQFVGSQEVLQVNHFLVEGTETLAADASCSRIKTPAGIFTEVELPVEEITASDDTINQAKIVFTAYNSTFEGAAYPLSTPSTLLMVRASKLTAFFENNELADDVTSFYTTFNKAYNQYEFNNIARLIATMNSERKQWMNAYADTHAAATVDEASAAYAAEYPDWNKVVLVPVTTLVDSNKSIFAFRHDMKLGSVRLQGGDPAQGGTLIPVKIITSAFKD